MSNKKQESAPVEGLVDGTDFVELKRDMQSAKVIAWLQYNQQQLIAGAVVLVLILVGISLWKEQQQSQKESASLLYIQAMNNPNQEERSALFESVIKEFPDSGYAILARLQSSTDADKRKEALEALVESHAAPEFSWQARLDLAALHLEEGDVDKASALLASHFGKAYEQARYALLAKASQDENEKVSLIQKALDAESHDNDLKAALEAELALLQASK